MVVTLLLLAFGLAKARTEPFSSTLNQKFETDSELIHRPPIWPTEPIPPPPKQDAEIDVKQFPIPPYCPPGFQSPNCKTH